MSDRLNNFNVNWDFSEDTKINLFAPTITGCSSQSQCISFSELNGYCFYEINAIEDTHVYIKEAFDCQPFKDGENKPFVYIRNIGNCNIYLRASNCNTGVFFNSGYFSFKQNKLSSQLEYSGIDYLINPNENILLTINSSQDGSKYISKSCLPFGFFYSINNSSAVDEFGSNTFKISGYPTFIYEEVSGIDISFFSTGNLNDFCLSKDSLLRYKDNPTTGNNWSAKLNENIKISNTGDNLSFWESGFCNFNINLNYKPTSFPDSFYSLLKIKNKNSLTEYLYTSGCTNNTGFFNNYDYDVFTIDKSGKLLIGPSLVSDANQTQQYSFDGVCLNSSLTFLSYCSNGDLYTGDFSISFILYPQYVTFQRQEILNTEKWSLYLCNNSLYYEDGFRNRVISNKIRNNEQNQVFFKKCSGLISLNNFICREEIDINSITGNQSQISLINSGTGDYSYSNLPIAQTLNLGFNKCTQNFFSGCLFNLKIENDCCTSLFINSYSGFTGCFQSCYMCDFGYTIFDGVNNNYAGIYTDNCSGAYLPYDNFTIEFFSKTDCLIGSSFFKLDGIEFNLCGGFAPLIMGNCHYIWNTGCYVTTGKWQHFAVSRLNGCVKVYVDFCCVFGVFNNCNFTQSNNLENYIGCGYFGCIHGFRYTKNQALYFTDCITTILPPLSCNGFLNCNQNITGEILFLGLQSMQLDSGWYDACVDCANSYAAVIEESGFYEKGIQEKSCAIFLCKNLFHFLETNSGLNLNEWNNLNLNVIDVTSGINVCIDINCINVLNKFKSYNETGFILPKLNLSGICYLTDCCQAFDSKIIEFHDIECGSTINGYISDFSICKDAKCLFVNFDWKNKNFFNLRSFGVCKSVNKLTDYEILFSNCYYGIANTISGNFKIGCNYNNFYLDTISAEITDEDGNKTIVNKENLNCYKFTGLINKDKNICIKYDIESCNENFKKYFYFYSGFQNERCHFICSLRSSKKILENPIILNSGYSSYLCSDLSGINQFLINSNDCPILNFSLCENSAIKDFVNQQYNKCNIYINGDQLDCYTFVSPLLNVNHQKNTGISGNWISINDFSNIITENFVNFTSSVELIDSGYCLNCAKMYEYTGYISENRFSTSSILNKNCFFATEAYLMIQSQEEESFFYCCLEFKYNPVVCVFYDGSYYEIPNCCSAFEYTLSGVTKCINFPLRGLSRCNFRIISDYEIFDKVSNSNFCLNYSGFNLNFCQGNNLNYICNKYWKLNSNSGVESPSIELKLNYSSTFQKNLKFYFNPFDSVLGDRLYCLKNLIFFALSDINSGIASDYLNYSGIEYGSSDYNFFFINLNQELINSNFQVPSGFCSILVDSAINFQNYYLNNPSPFKTSDSDLYNYILPITTGIQYTDSVLLLNSCCLQNSILDFGVWNYCSLFKNITGGSIGSIYCSGNCSGYYTGFLKNSSLILSPCDFILRFPSSDIHEWSGNKSFEIKKGYTFSGVQPIFIQSNYALSEIKNPIVNKAFNNYNYNNDGLSGNYYYMYSLLNNENLNFKFISPEGTRINFVCWNDQSGDKSLIYGSVCENGSIIENVGFLKFELNKAISCNEYFYNEGNLKIYIDLVGGI